MDYICEIHQLSLARAEKIAPAAFLPAWKWYMEHAGEIGPRPYGKHQPEGIDIRLAAQRGIHKPSGFDYALAITSTKQSGDGNSFYADQPIIKQDDGTWLLQYSAHRNNKEDASKYDDTWNQSLRACMQDGIPVAVFIPEKSGLYTCMGLAFVEAYNDNSGLFTLHGPVTSEQASDFWSLTEVDSMSPQDLRALEEMDDYADERTRRIAERVVREGQQAFRAKLVNAYEGKCAATSCGVNEVLQAAHIIGYRGKASQSTNNGLLLRSDIHQLYDAHLLSINPSDMRIELRQELEGSGYEKLIGKQISLPKKQADRPDERRLDVHFQEFKRFASNGIA